MFKSVAYIGKDPETGFYVAVVPGIPGAHTQAETLDELQNNLSDDLRWEDKASYNTKTERADFPFYYSSAQANIIGWAKEIFAQNRAPEKKA